MQFAVIPGLLECEEMGYLSALDPIGWIGWNMTSRWTGSFEPFSSQILQRMIGVYDYKPSNFLWDTTSMQKKITSMQDF